MFIRVYKKVFDTKNKKKILIYSGNGIRAFFRDLTKMTLSCTRTYTHTNGKLDG